VSASTPKKIVGYFEDWSANPSAAVLRNYTHVNFAFVETSSTSCQLSVPAAAKVDLVKQAGAKIVGSLGGASMNKFWIHCTVDNLVTQLVSIVSRLGLDGVDIDYEVDPPNQTFVVELNNRLRTALPAGKLLTHAPENNMMVSGGAYWNILQKCNGVDYISVQYYNDHPDPISNPSGSISHYEAIVKNLYAGDATKVVFGYCITDCPRYNMGAAAAAAFTKQLVTTVGANFGGVMNWAINQGDADGSWSRAVRTAMA
jgi:chitinase